VDAAEYHKLPPEIGCLIESVEVRQVVMETLHGTTTATKVWVKLIPKTEALKLAARAQLGDKHTIVPAQQVDWDEIARRGAMIKRGSELDRMLKGEDLPGTQPQSPTHRMIEQGEALPKAPATVVVQATPVPLNGSST